MTAWEEETMKKTIILMRAEYPLDHSLCLPTDSHKGPHRGLVHLDVGNPAISMRSEHAPQNWRFRSASISPALALCGIPA